MPMLGWKEAGCTGERGPQKAEPHEYALCDAPVFMSRVGGYGHAVPASLMEAAGTPVYRNRLLESPEQ